MALKDAPPHAMALKDAPPHTKILPTDPTDAPPPAVKPPPPATATTESPPPTLEEEKNAMTGVFQLFLGLMCVLFSLTAAVRRVLLLHPTVCTSVLLVVAAVVILSFGNLSAVKSITLFEGISLLIIATWGFTCLQPLRYLLSWQVHLAASWSVLSLLLSTGGVAYLSWLLTRPLPEDWDEVMCEEMDYDGRCIDDNFSLWSVDIERRCLQGLFLVPLMMQMAFSFISIRAAQQRPLQTVHLLQPNSP